MLVYVCALLHMSKVVWIYRECLFILLLKMKQVHCTECNAKPLMNDLPILIKSKTNGNQYQINNKKKKRKSQL